jgi:hypothetical protein
MSNHVLNTTNLPSNAKCEELELRVIGLLNDIANLGRNYDPSYLERLVGFFWRRAQGNKPEVDLNQKQMRSLLEDIVQVLRFAGISIQDIINLVDQQGIRNDPHSWSQIITSKVDGKISRDHLISAIRHALLSLLVDSTTQKSKNGFVASDGIYVEHETLLNEINSFIEHDLGKEVKADLSSLIAHGLVRRASILMIERKDEHLVETPLCYFDQKIVALFLKEGEIPEVNWYPSPADGCRHPSRKEIGEPSAFAAWPKIIFFNHDDKTPPNLCVHRLSGRESKPEMETFKALVVYPSESEADELSQLTVHNEDTSHPDAVPHDILLAGMLDVLRNGFDFNASPEQRNIWLTVDGRLFVSQNLLGRLASHFFKSRGYSVEINAGLLADLGLLKNAHIVLNQRKHRHNVPVNVETTLYELDAARVWADRQDQPTLHCQLALSDRISFFRSTQNILDVPAIFQEWPKVGFLLHTPERLSDEEPSHSPVSDNEVLRAVLTIYPTEKEIEHLRAARRTSK